MAEEAVGLAKSLGWSIEWGPSLVTHDPADPSSASPLANAVDSSEVIPSAGRQLGPTRSTVEGEPINNWDKVYIHGTNMHGYYLNGRLMIDTENYTDSGSDTEELNEWTDPELRQNLAASGLVRIRQQGAPGFFGKGKVVFKQIAEISSHVAKTRVSAVFVNSLLSPGQQRNLET